MPCVRSRLGQKHNVAPPNSECPRTFWLPIRSAPARVAPKRNMGLDPRMDVKKNYFVEEWNGALKNMRAECQKISASAHGFGRPSGFRPARDYGKNFRVQQRQQSLALRYVRRRVF